MSDAEFQMAMVIVVLGGILVTGLMAGLTHIVGALDRWWNSPKRK